MFPWIQVEGSGNKDEICFKMHFCNSSHGWGVRKCGCRLSKYQIRFSTRSWFTPAATCQAAQGTWCCHQLVLASIRSGQLAASRPMPSQISQTFQVQSSAGGIEAGIIHQPSCSSLVHLSVGDLFALNQMSEMKIFCKLGSSCPSFVANFQEFDTKAMIDQPLKERRQCQSLGNLGAKRKVGDYLQKRRLDIASFSLAIPFSSSAHIRNLRPAGSDKIKTFESKA